MIWESERFSAYVPFFARYPFEVHIAARAHLPSLAEMAAAAAGAPARAIKAVGTAYDYLFGFPLPYMMVMHQKPTDGREHPDAHFHVEFYPSTAQRTNSSTSPAAKAGRGRSSPTWLPRPRPRGSAKRWNGAGTPRVAGRSGKGCPGREMVPAKSTKEVKIGGPGEDRRVAARGLRRFERRFDRCAT